MPETRIRIVSEGDSAGIEKIDAGLAQLGTHTEALTQQTQAATAATKEQEAAMAALLKTSGLALEIAEKEALATGDDAKLQSVRDQQRELQLMAKLAGQYGLSLDEAAGAAKELAALEKQAAEAVGARAQAAKDAAAAERELNAERERLGALQRQDRALSALALEAGGDAAGAAAMREEIALRDRAAVLQRQLNLEEHQALAMAGEEIALRRQIATARETDLLTAKAQDALNDKLVLDEAARLAAERAITLEKEKQDALQFGILKRGAGQLAGQVGLGGLSSALTGGLGGLAVFAGIEVGMRVINGLFDDFGKTAEEATDKAKKGGKETRDIYDGLGRKIGEVKDKTDDFAAAQETAKRQLQELHDRFKAAADQAERLRRAEDALGGAKLGADIAAVDLKEARGEITPEEANAQRGKLRVAEEAAKLDRAAEAARAPVRGAAALVGEQATAADRAQAAVEAGRKDVAAALREQEAAKAADQAVAERMQKQMLGGGPPTKQAEDDARASGERLAAAAEALTKAQTSLAAKQTELETRTKTLGEAQDQLTAATKEAKQKLEVIGYDRQKLATDEKVTAAKTDAKQTKDFIEQKQQEAADQAKAAGEMKKFQTDKQKEAERRMEKDIDEGIHFSESIMADEREAQAAAKMEAAEGRKDAKEDRRTKAEMRSAAEAKVAKNQPHLSEKGRARAVDREVERMKGENYDPDEVSARESKSFFEDRKSRPPQANAATPKDDSKSVAAVDGAAKNVTGEVSKLGQKVQGMGTEVSAAIAGVAGEQQTANAQILAALDQLKTGWTEVSTRLSALEATTA